MQKIKVVLWDIDGTLLDFIAAQAVAIRTLFQKFGLGECPDDMLKDYSEINKKYWQLIECKKIQKQEGLLGRFYEFFEKYSLDTGCIPSFNDEYQIRLGDTVCFIDGSKKVLDYFSKNGILQYGATNGTKIAQDRKLKKSKLEEVFVTTFISDNIGYEKPSKQFFDYAISVIKEKIPDIKKDEIVIIGDSLTSDIRGGVEYGINTIWFNPKQETTNLSPTYIIEKLEDIINLNII